MIKCIIILLAVLTLSAEEPKFEWILKKEHYKDGSIQSAKGGILLQADNLKFSQEKPAAAQFSNHRALLKTEKSPFSSKSFTVEAWVMLNKTAKWGGIVSFIQDNGSYERGWLLGYRNDKFCFTAAGDKNKKLDYMTAKASFSPGYWYQLTGTYDGTSQKLYADGILIATKKTKGGNVAWPEKTLIAFGSYMDDNDFYPMDGELSRIAVFNKALSQKEIQLRFHKHKGSYPGIEGTIENKGDWLTYMGDNLRNGISPVTLPFPLRTQWIYRSRHKPSPAWPRPAKMDYWRNNPLQPRVTFDRAYHIVGKNNRIYFGSSADHKIYCLDAISGKEVWSCFTEGPVRLAPSIKDHRVLAGSDDGFIYCLDSSSGKLLWRKRLAKEDRRLPGNEQIISRWPVRTGVLIEENLAHFCAGIFPNEGVFRGAVDLNTDKVIANIPIKFSPQGYLKKSGSQIEVSQGRNLAKSFLTKLKRNVKNIPAEVKALPVEYAASFIKAGSAQIGGGKDKIMAVDSRSGKILWKAAVKGTVYSLAVIRGRLYASTDEGYIYCFGGKAGRPALLDGKKPPVLPYADLKEKIKLDKIASQIIASRPESSKGFLLAVDCPPALITSLIQRSSYQIVTYKKSTTKADELRNILDKAGIYGIRAAVHEISEDKQLPYTAGMFNMILDPNKILSEKEIKRLIHPYSGIALRDAAFKDKQIGKKPAGAGSWTHMYADPANTNCSKDTLVGSSLELQWFGPPGPRKMIDRHHRTIAPLSSNGRLFIPGENLIICSDAWNGTVLWEIELPQSMRILAQKDCSYIALDDRHLHAAAADKCYLYNVEDGSKAAVLNTGRSKTEWGFLAVYEGQILGSSVSEGSIRRTQSYENPHSITHRDYVPVIVSNSLFSYTKPSLRKAWSYTPKGGIINPSICLTEEAVYFIESHNRKTLEGQQTLKALLSEGSSIVKLDLKTGKEMWRKSCDTADLRHNIYLASKNGVIICNGSKNINEKAPGIHKPNNGEVRYKLIALDCKDGSLLWQREMNPKLAGGKDHGEADRRPVIIKQKVYLEPFCYDLKTGTDITAFNYQLRKRNGCGQLTASAKSFFFRHSSAGTFDISSNKLSKITAVTRPGCWLNMIPANGLLLIPEASSGCICNFAIQTSLAFRPVDNGSGKKNNNYQDTDSDTEDHRK